MKQGRHCHAIYTSLPKVRNQLYLDKCLTSAFSMQTHWTNKLTSWRRSVARLRQFILVDATLSKRHKSRMALPFVNADTAHRFNKSHCWAIINICPRAHSQLHKRVVIGLSLGWDGDHHTVIFGIGDKLQYHIIAAQIIKYPIRRPRHCS